MTNLTQVAVVGAGNMGGGMLARLRGLGWSVAVHDVDPQIQSQAVALGAVACGSALEAARMLVPDGELMVVVVDLDVLELLCCCIGCHCCIAVIFILCF